tara:strand:+ start:420 stop:707 length:288 start_codon:yes stop_codon:yes gene_type:complete
MTKIAEANKQQQVYDCYLKGMTPETTAKHLNLSYKYVKNKYEDFTIHSATLRGNDKAERIAQSWSIERDLFETIKNDPEDITINNKSFIYSNFCV